MNVMLSLSKLLTRSSVTLQTLPHHRSLWQYLNIIFNRKDQHRWKTFGPDRTCAEWILRNGGKVELTCCKGFLSDYNLIPPEGVPIVLTSVDATESTIMHYGFDHFQGCKKLNKIILNKCNYVYDEALKELLPIGNQLKFLEVTECHSVTDAGMMHLSGMKALNALNIGGLTAVKDIKVVAEKLQSDLPNCKVSIN